MKRNDLHPLLRSEYREEKGCGVEKVDDPDYHNIWFVIPPPLPRSPVSLPKDQTRALAVACNKANDVLNRLEPFARMEDLDRLTAFVFARQEAVTSSRIEGTFSTIDEALSPAVEREQAPGEERSSAASVRAYAKGLEYAFQKIHDQGESALTVELFCNLHKRIMAHDPAFDGVPGQLRRPGAPRSIVQIGGHLGRRDRSLYNPAPPRHVLPLMDQFVAWLSDPQVREEGDAGLGNPLPVRMALAHAHFEAIHPFSDGNGRVGRMIWPLQMILSGKRPLYLSGFAEQEREAYYEALKEAQQKLRYLPMIEFLSEAFVVSESEEGNTRKALQELQQLWRERSSPRKGSSAERLLAVLITAPILTIDTASKTLNVSFPAAARGLEQLEQAGVVRERTGQKRARVFAAEEVIAILSRPFGANPQSVLRETRKKLGL